MSNVYMKTVPSVQDVVSEVLDGLKQRFTSREDRAVVASAQQSAVHKLLEHLKSELIAQCSEASTTQMLALMQDAADVVTTGNKNRRRASSVNELAAIFEEIAKSETDLISQYCANDSSLCLPGPKGDKGDPGPPGPKGDPGSGSGVAGASCCMSLSTPSFNSTSIPPIRIAAGNDVTLMCDVDGYPPPVVTWIPNLSTLDASRYSVNGTRLTLHNVNGNDPKLFTCVATNVFGTQSKNFSLDIFSNMQFMAVPNNQTVMMGESVTWNCTVNGPFTPDVKWYHVMKNGDVFPLSESPNLHIKPIAGGSQLTVDRVSQSTTGEYVCQSDNTVQNITSSAFIIAKGPPHVIKAGSPSGVVNVTKGENVVLRCEAEWHPPGNWTWNYPPGVNNAYMDVDGSLVVMNADIKDSKYFICIASNEFGQDHATVTLKVKVPPEVRVNPTNNPVVTGLPVTVECFTAGDQPLDVTWYHDGQKVINDGVNRIVTNDLLVIPSSTEADLGQYTCVASNHLGRAEASSYVYTDRGDVTCSDTLGSCTTVCGANCPSGCSDSQVMGTNTFAQTSSICGAGIRSHAVASNTGGTVVWRNNGTKTQVINI